MNSDPFQCRSVLSGAFAKYGMGLKMSQMAYKADSPSEKGITHLANAPLSGAFAKLSVLFSLLETLSTSGHHAQNAIRI